MQGLSRRSHWTWSSVAALVLCTLTGCQGGTVPEEASDPTGTAARDVAQVGGESPGEAAELALEALAAGDCTRLREVGPGLYPEAGMCASIVASNGPDQQVDLRVTEERVDGDVAVVDADLDGEASKLLAVDTAAGWLVVALGSEDDYEQVPDLGVPGTVTDAMRAAVEASRSDDCDAYVMVYPGENEYDCRRMEADGLDEVLEVPGDPGSPLVTANVSLIEGDAPRTREVLLVRTVEDRWIIAGFIT